MNIFLIGSIIAIVIIIVIGIIWIANEPSSPPIPEGGKERLIWQAQHGNLWAQQVLMLMEGSDLALAIIDGYKEVIADAGIEITRENPAHVKLDDAMEELHNWIARTFNKEEC